MTLTACCDDFATGDNDDVFFSFPAASLVDDDDDDDDCCSFSDGEDADDVAVAGLEEDLMAVVVSVVVAVAVAVAVAVVVTAVVTAVEAADVGEVGEEAVVLVIAELGVEGVVLGAELSFSLAFSAAA